MPFLSPDFWRDLVSLAYLSIAAIIILLVVVGLARTKPKDKRTWLLVPLVAAVVFAPGGWLKFKKWQAGQEWAQKQAAQIAQRVHDRLLLGIGMIAHQHHRDWRQGRIFLEPADEIEAGVAIDVEYTIDQYQVGRRYAQQVERLGDRVCFADLRREITR